MEDNKEKEAYVAPTAKVESANVCDDIMVRSLPYSPMNLGDEYELI